jgi:hypothetical protein
MAGQAVTPPTEEGRSAAGRFLNRVHSQISDSRPREIRIWAISPVQPFWWLAPQLWPVLIGATLVSTRLDWHSVPDLLVS